MAQILAKVKGLGTHITSLSESEAKRTNQILTHLKEVEAQVKVVEGVAGEGSGVHAKKTCGGSRSTSGDHLLLKICHDSESPMTFVLRTSAHGTYDLFSDVWSRGVWEQGKMYK